MNGDPCRRGARELVEGDPNLADRQLAVFVETRTWSHDGSATSGSLSRGRDRRSSQTSRRSRGHERWRAPHPPCRTLERRTPAISRMWWRSFQPTAPFVVCGQGVVWPGIGTTPRLFRGVVSRSKCWRARRDSNPRPLGPQPNALSTELRAHMTLRRDWRRGRDSNPRSRLPHSTV